MRSSGDGGNAGEGLLAVGSILGGGGDHSRGYEGRVDDIEEEEELKAAEKKDNSRVSDFHLAEINFCFHGTCFQALGACGRLDGWHQQAPAGLGTAVGGYMVGGAH